MVVDLPAPFGPRKPVTRPGSAVKETSSTAVKSPYFLVRCVDCDHVEKPRPRRAGPHIGEAAEPDPGLHP